MSTEIPTKYRKRPIVIEAMQVGPLNHSAIEAFVGRDLDIHPEGGLVIVTLEGPMHARFGDYIIRGVQGEFYPCKPEIFEQTYEIVS